MAGKTTKQTKTETTPAEENKPFVKTPDGTIEFRLKIPWTLVEKERKLVVAEMAKNANIPGFRKGKAPQKLVESQLNAETVQNEVIRHLLPQAYAEAVKKHDVKPIMDPQIHLDTQLEEGKDWEFHALTCEAPAVDLGNYKEAIGKFTAKSKIVVPGKEQGEVKMDDILQALLTSAKLTIPAVLIQKEADRLLSQMLDEIKRLGMNLDQYLASTGKTAEDVRAEYAQKAQNDLKLELVLQKVAEDAKISVEDAEIQKTIDNAKPEEKQSLEANRYLLASIIRQQKTLDYLKSL
jgi:FKBP-type peptidyl-prolyl cis-trans isomerase (trigger factor)